MALKYFPPQGRTENYGNTGSGVANDIINEKTPYWETNEWARAQERKAIDRYRSENFTDATRPAEGMLQTIPNWNDQLEKLKSMESAKYQNNSISNGARAATTGAQSELWNPQKEAEFQRGQQLDSRGFSRNFLEYLQAARAKKLEQAQADIGKTTAETELTGTQSGLATAQAALARSQGMLSNAQAQRVSALTPAEVSQTQAQTNLLGQQAGLTGAQAGLTGLQAIKTALMTPYEIDQLRMQTESIAGTNAMQRYNSLRQGGIDWIGLMKNQNMNNPTTQQLVNYGIQKAGQYKPPSNKFFKMGAS